MGAPRDRGTPSIARPRAAVEPATAGRALDICGSGAISPPPRAPAAHLPNGGASTARHRVPQEGKRNVRVFAALSSLALLLAAPDALAASTTFSLSISGDQEVPGPGDPDGLATGTH